ncbi:MAG: hypothetical protein MUF49_14940 [Oculatellaceae cyanobacterium Prado106]|jgi:predicted transposase YdaD|nr:hypothetical protein [Oculatellaceae cyanobacterium Prado106]
MPDEVLWESVIYQSIWQEGVQIGEARGRARGEARGESIGAANKQREIAINCLREGLPVEVIAHATGFSIAEVQQIQQALNESLKIKISSVISDTTPNCGLFEFSN